MWSIIGVLIVTAAIIAYEIPKLTKRRSIRDGVVFGFLIVIGCTAAVLGSLHVDLPNPVTGINAVFKPLGSMIYESFK
ncbi:hypothetical protein PALU110988_13105 [Paenibacillus lupini]|uniref:hypothetical protein n=1 Tax=Paenibacillus lupini TaxID=1450204 RepID=UPI001420C505|nr:hypothetical protein [Paenibacillus lupini]NIK26148.1 hypothetical protein [Paenibacillus lupini]